MACAQKAQPGIVEVVALISWPPVALRRPKVLGVVPPATAMQDTVRAVDGHYAKSAEGANSLRRTLRELT